VLKNTDFFGLNEVVRGFIGLIYVHEHNSAFRNTVPSVVRNVLTNPILIHNTKNHNVLIYGTYSQCRVL